MLDSTVRVIRYFAGGIGVRQVRLACGLVMFSYLLSHFTNHALGLVSFDAMQDGLEYHMEFWRDPIVAFVLYTAATIHWGLGLWALYERREFRYPGAEITQLVLGLTIPFLLVTHFVGLRLQSPLFNRNFSYAQVIVAYWINRPYVHWIQFTVLIVAWTHACIGLYFWLRLKRWFAKAAPILLAAAVLWPTLAILGLVEGAREVVALDAQPEWRAENAGPERFSNREQRVLLDTIIFDFQIVYPIVILLILGARGVRLVRERRGEKVRLRYPDGRIVVMPKGTTVLEASLRNKVPHASVCGGKARCSTCRIRVVSDLSDLPEPSRRESYVLERVGASADPAVRLACQLRPQSDIAFFLVFPPQLTAARLHGSVRARPGEERYVVSVFVDMRRSTTLAEKRLPFDTMFLINRFLAAVSHAVEDAGGRPNQFVGDGVFALFGLDCAPEVACRQALTAIGKIAANVEELNREFVADLREPIRFGIGVNGGEVVIGDVGYKDYVVFTALGDPVNIAARLQDMTKELSCEVLIAEDVCRRAGVGANALSTREIAIRGRDEPLSVRTAAEARLVGALAA